jgi:hypothetical protein
MKRNRSNFWALILAMVLVSTAGATLAAAPYAKGEVIRYGIKKMGIKVGEATLEFKGEIVREGKKYTLIVFTAKGFNFYDEERIFVDGKSFFPKLVLRDVKVFGKNEQFTEAYDQKAGTVTITKVAKGKTTVRVLEKTGPIDNIYGFIYRYRLHGRFEPGGTGPDAPSDHGHHDRRRQERAVQSGRKDLSGPPPAQRSS